MVCSSTQFMVSVGTAGAVCKDKIASGELCYIGSYDRITNKTCKSGYCNNTTKKCEDDPNCTGIGKYKLTTGAPFLGAGKGQCINVDTAMDTFLSTILKFILGSVGTVTVIIIITAGFMWSFSAGNKNTIAKAQKMIQDATIGLILTLTSGLMLQVINPQLLDLGSLFTKIKPTQVNIMGITEPTAAQASNRTQPPVSCNSNIKPETKAYIQNHDPYATVPYDDTKDNQQCYRIDKNGQNVRETLSWSGCGPTAVAKVLKSLGVNVTPKETAKYNGDNGFVQCDAGTDPAFIQSIASSNGLKYEYITNKDLIRSILQAGNPVIALVKGPGGSCNEYFAPPGGGHYIVVSCFDSSNNSVAIDDPYAWEAGPRTSAYFDSLINCLKVGGVYYIHK